MKTEGICVSDTGMICRILSIKNSEFRLIAVKFDSEKNLGGIFITG